MRNPSEDRAADLISSEAHYLAARVRAAESARRDLVRAVRRWSMETAYKGGDPEQAGRDLLEVAERHTRPDDLDRSDGQTEAAHG